MNGPEVAVPEMSAVAAELLAKIESRQAKIAVVGLGYVGLPLAGALEQAGYKVLGFDVDESKIAMLDAGTSYLKHLGDALFSRLADSDQFEAITEPNRLGEADAVLLCVPTPLGQHNEPDLSYVTGSTQLVAQSLRVGQIIILESTTYPGTTREEMQPILEATGLICGQDFFLAYSPEREDPGRENMTTSKIPKLVGGVDTASGDLAYALYSNVIEDVHRVSSAEVAESAKLLENIYRAVNIALVNELKVVLTELNVDIWEVIDAAATKPFGFQAFYPGPGLGGHCIPIDPFYLTWKAREIGHNTKFIELAGEVNAQMPEYVVHRISGALNELSKSVRGSKILIIGIAYKPDVDDIREAPAAEIIELLQQKGAMVSYHDPHVSSFPSMRRYQIELDSVELTQAVLKESDCVVIVTNHKKIDYEMIAESSGLIVDTRNAIRDSPALHAKLIKA